MCTQSRLALILAIAGAGFSSTAMAQKSDPVQFETTSGDGLVARLPAPALVDDPAALELANKLGLNVVRPGLRGLPGCDIVFDVNNCHPADITLAANFSGTNAGAFRTMDNVTSAASNPTQLCWIGRYAGRVVPAVANESFQVRIFADLNGFPDLSAPIFERTFSQNGAAGTDLLELSCLDGETCPGTPTPAAGGHYVYSATVTGGFPLVGNGCYWIEIACVGSANAGVSWGWVGTTQGNDLTSLQAADGNYTLFSRVVNDRALCLSGGVNTGLGNCVIAPQPPICSNDPANGIAYDNVTTFGMRASWLGSVGRPSGTGAWTPVQRAENMSFSAGTSVSSICFGGFWLGVTDAGTTIGIAAAANPAFRVAYFSNSDTLGVPGAPVPLAEFAAGDPGVTFVWDGDDVANMMHPAVNLPANACSWVSVGRVQSQQAIGAPTAPLWHWQLTTSPNPAADRRFASRTLAATPGAWGPTTVANAGDTSISNLWFLLNAGPVVPRVCAAAACQIPIPGGVIQENEPLCGLSAGGDLVNGGCNSATPVFSQISCGQTVRGTVAFNGTTRDTDWYQFTIPASQSVTVTVNAEFVGFAGFIGAAGEPIVNLVCGTPGIAISPFVSVASCTPASITRTLGPGTYTLIVVPDFGNTIDCGNNTGSEYTLNVTCTAPPTPPANDLCENSVLLATPCTGDDVSASGTTLGSTVDGQLACGTATAQTSGGVWYRVVGNGSPITASTCATVGGYDAQISVYTGSCGAFVCAAGDDDGCGPVGGMSTVTWNTVDGTTYHILMHGFGASTGAFDLVLSSTAACSGGCSADWDNNGTVNSNDISAFITSWLSSVSQGNLIADFNNDGFVNSNDISAFITAWLAQINTPC